MDKKGSWVLDSMPWMAVFVIVVGVLFTIFLVFLNSTSSDVYQIPPGTEETILKERFFGNCFWEQEELTGNYVSMISWEKFDQKNLDDCYNILGESKDLGFRLRLTVGGEEKSIETRNWRAKPVYGEGQKVNVWKDGQQAEGNLLVEVQNAE